MGEAVAVVTLTPNQHAALVHLVSEKLAELESRPGSHSNPTQVAMVKSWEQILLHVRAESAAALLTHAHRTIEDCRVAVDRAVATFNLDTAPARRPISRIGRRR